MKAFRKIFVLLLALLVLFCLASCSAGDNDDDGGAENSGSVGSATVNLRYPHSGSISSFKSEVGKPIKTPEALPRENYIFLGWFTDPAGKNRFDFSTPLSGELDLYAVYKLDASELTNRINLSAVFGVVTVEARCNKEFWFIDYGSCGGSQGSGFCFYISDDGYYYILTNCHVAKKCNDYDEVKYTVTDSKDRTYEAFLYRDAVLAEYDLACLYFKSDDSEVRALTLANKNAAVGEDVIVVGTPHGQQNYINYGKVQTFRQIKLSDTDPYESNVTFDVMCSDAKSAKGCSGGPVFNDKLEVVGVTYAGSLNESPDDDGRRSFAIPIERVWEFLDKYVYGK